MIDKHKVLPLVQLPSNENKSLAFAVGAILEVQRDADLVILQRDYVPKEQFELLVKAVKGAVGLLQVSPMRYQYQTAVLVLKDAMMKLGVERETP